MADPVSWLQIEQGWNVVSSDAVIVGTVAQVEGDKQSDIFDGLAVQSEGHRQIVYVPGEQVGAIHPGQVTLKLASEAVGTLPPISTIPARDDLAPGTTTDLDADFELATAEALTRTHVPGVP